MYGTEGLLQQGFQDVVPEWHESGGRGGGGRLLHIACHCKDPRHLKSTQSSVQFGWWVVWKVLELIAYMQNQTAQLTIVSYVC